MATPLAVEDLMGKMKRKEQLSEKQREIMEVVWELGEASVFEVRDELAKQRDVARNTVRTMMERLEERGWLTHRVIGRTHFYSALVDRHDNLGQRVVDVVDKVCGGSPENLMSALLEFRGLSSEEIARIEKILKEAKKRASNE
ncbi:MAG: BlaI/MecI/CopY family transcriptional regulator [Planctomycetota bacterium]